MIDIRMRALKMDAEAGVLRSAMDTAHEQAAARTAHGAAMKQLGRQLEKQHRAASDAFKAVSLEYRKAEARWAAKAPLNQHQIGIIKSSLY